MERVESLAGVRHRGTARALVALARPHQWLKNLLVLAALLFGQRLLDPRDDLLALGALVAFCALSSLAYTINDFADRERDRMHPDKRNRPLACGDLSTAQAAWFAAVLAAIALALSIAIGPDFLLIAAIYVALQIAYSAAIKHVIIADVIAVAIGFVLRAYAGGVAIGVPVSPWLIFITFVLALFLVLGRRRQELAALGPSAAAHRGPLEAYSVRLIDQMLAIVAGATLVGYMIYTASPEVAAKLHTQYLYITVPFVVFGILRYLYLIDERNQGGDPARLLLTDRPLQIAVILWLIADIALLYL